MKKTSTLLIWAAIITQIGSSNAFVSGIWKTAAGKEQEMLSSSTLLPPAPYATSVKRKVYSQPDARSPGAAGEKDLTPETIAEMIEVSFIQSCLQLSQGYVDVLKLFIVAVKTGYTKNIPLDELNQLVQDCPVNSAGRELMKEESELRREWMMVVYEMMKVLLNENEHKQATIASNNDDDDSQTRVAQVVDFMLLLQKILQREDDKSGGEQDSIFTLTNLTVEKAVQKLPSLSQLLDSIQNPMEKAFLTNDIRVALLTFKVLEEEKVCLEGSKGNRATEEIPRPPIKGT